MTAAGHALHVAARQEVRLHLLRRNLDAGLHQGDLLPDDHAVIDLAQLHADHVEDADPRPGQEGTESTAARS